MTPRPKPTKAKPRGKALPPIYVVVDGDGFVWASSANRTKKHVYNSWKARRPVVGHKIPGDRIVKYVPERRSSR